MNALYARAVLWLIRPALELRDQANREVYAAMNEARNRAIKQVYESLGTSAKAGMNALTKASAADEPVFTGIAKGKPGWFEEATESPSPAASEDATPLPPVLPEAQPPGHAPSPEKAASPAAAPSGPSNSPLCVEDPETTGEKPLD